MSALDAKLRKTMQLELKRIQSQVGITFLYVTHDQEEAMTMSDRIVVMNRGRIEGLGSPRDVYEQPSTEFVATIVGTLLALALVRYEGKKFRGRRIVDQTLFMNIAAPEIVMGASLLGMFASYHIARGFTTLLISHAVFSLAYVTVTVRARLQGFDRHLEEAAGDLGSTPLTTFRLVTLPMIMPGVLAGAMMAFALSLDDFVVSNFVAGTTLPFPVWVYGATRMGVPPQVFVFGTLIFLLGAAAAIGSLVMSRRGMKRT